MEAAIAVTAAMKAGMLRHMDDEEEHSFNPTEVLLYQHAQDSKCVELGYLLYML